MPSFDRVPIAPSDPFAASKAVKDALWSWIYAERRGADPDELAYLTDVGEEIVGCLNETAVGRALVAAIAAELQKGVLR